MSDNFDLTPLLTAATTAHEMFKAFVEAGFTEDQALQIVISVLTGSLK